MADSYQLKALLSAVDKITPVVKEVAKNAKKYLGDVATSAGKLSDKLGLPIAALSSLTAGLSVVAIKRAVYGYAELSEELVKMGLRSGIATDELQRMKYVAEQSGVPFEAFVGSMAKLNLNLGNAGAGKNPALLSMLKRLKIDLRDAQGRIRSGIDILPELADAFEKNKNAAQRARMGNAEFGKQWQEMVPMLADGSDEIAKSLDRFKRLKGVIPEDSLREAKELGDQLSDLEFLTKSFSNTIAAQLVPVLRPLLEDLIQWAAQNRKLIQSQIKEYVQGLAEWIKSVDWKGLAQGAKEVVDGVGWLVQQLGGARNALIALVVFMNISTIASFAGLLGSVFRLGKGVFGLGSALLGGLSPMQKFATNLGEIDKLAGTAVGTMGKLGTAIGVVGAAYAGWEIGKLLNEYAINPLAEKLTGVEGETLGTALYGVFGDNYDPNAGTQRSVIQPRQAAAGAVTVSFQNAPQGMSVLKTAASPGLDLTADVGYRSSFSSKPIF